MTDTEIDISGLSVMLAMPVHRDLPWQTVLSLMETQAALAQRGIAYEIRFEVGCSIIEMARSKIVHGFLESGHNRLFWLDSDMAWRPQDFFRLLALSTAMPVVGGIYPVKRDPPFYFLNVKPGAELRTNEFGCVALDGLGLGFCCMAREPVEQASATAPRLLFPDMAGPIPHPFRCDDIGGLFRGEDGAFFADLAALGYPCWLDPTVELGHVGSKEYRARLSDVLGSQPANMAVPAGSIEVAAE